MADIASIANRLKDMQDRVESISYPEIDANVDVLLAGLTVPELKQVSSESGIFIAAKTKSEILRSFKDNLKELKATYDRGQQTKSMFKPVEAENEQDFQPEAGEDDSALLELEEFLDENGDFKKMQEGGKVPEDPTKHAAPGKRDKIPAELEPGEVVASRQDVAAMQSLLTTGGAKGMGLGQLAGSPKGGMPQVAKGPGGSGIAGALGQPPLQLSGGSGPEGVTDDKHPKFSSSTSAKEMEDFRISVRDIVQDEGRKPSPSENEIKWLFEKWRTSGIVQEQADFLGGYHDLHDEWDNQADTGQKRTTVELGPLAKPPSGGPHADRATNIAKDPNGSGLGLDTVKGQTTAQSQLGPLAKPQQTGLLAGMIGEGNQPVQGSGNEDWSLPDTSISQDGMPTGLAKPPSSGFDWGSLGTSGTSQGMAKGPSGSASATGNLDAPKGGKSRGGGIAKSPRGGGIMGALGMASQIYLQGMGYPTGGMGGGVGRDSHGRFASMLGGAGQMGDVLGAGGGGSGGGGDASSEELIDAIKDLIEAVKKLTEAMGTKDSEKIGPAAYLESQAAKASGQAQANTPLVHGASPDNTAINNRLTEIMSRLH